MCLQMQEQLASLAEQAKQNVMYVLHGEKHIFTNNAIYMKRLVKMKAYIMHKKQAVPDPDADACDAEDQVSPFRHGRFCDLKA